MERHGGLPSLGGWALAVSIGFGPIYWLPDVPDALVFNIKAAAMTLFAAIFVMNGGFRLPDRLFAGLFIFSLIAAISSAYHGDTFFLNALTLSAIAIFAGTVALSSAATSIWKYVEWGVLIFAVFAGLVIIDGLRGGVTPNPFYEYFYPLSLSGFAGGRTGWGVTCGFMLAISLIASVHRKTKYALGWLAIGTIFATNSLLVGTRGGTITAVLLLGAFIVVSYRFGNRTLAITSAVVLTIGTLIFAVLNIEWLETSRVFQGLFSESGQRNLRIAGYGYSWGAILERPFTGWGEFSLENEFGYASVHNLWLRLIVERGIIAGAIIAAVILRLLLPLMKTPVHGVSFLLIAGLTPTMFEPTAIFGNYFSTFGYWFVCIFLLGFSAPHVLSSRDLLPVSRRAGAG